MGTFWKDLRFGLRLAASRPGFTAVAVIALALGIGPNTAIFSIVNSLLLTPPPYDDPDTIVTASQKTTPTFDGPRLTLPSTDDFQDWRRETRTLQQIALYASDSLTLTGFEDPIRLDGARVSPAMFPLLRVKPIVGRMFTEQEEQLDAAPVVILSYRLWDRKLGRDSAIIGKPIVLDGIGRQVIGIMPEGFEFPTKETEYWTPLTLTPPERNPNERRVMMVPFIARLKPGVTPEQAAAEGNAIIVRNQEPGPGEAPPQVPPDRRVGGPGAGPAPGRRGEGAPPEGAPGGPGLVVRRGPVPDQSQRAEGGPSGGPAGGPGLVIRRGLGPGKVQRVPLQLVTLQERQGGPFRPALLVLSAAVAFVLLIACANVANLLLSRAAVRHREFSIRAALGAGSGRVVRQMLTESSVLSLAGGALGVLLAYWVVKLLPRLGGALSQRLADVRLDLRALVFAAGISLLTTVLFGLVPALASASEGLAQSLKESGLPGAAGLRLSGRNRARSLLAITQVALAMMLLVGAGLLTRSFVTLLRQDLGYQPSGALTLQLRLPRARYQEPQSRIAFYEQLLAGVRRVPGVQAAGLTNLMPMSQAQIRISFELPGRPVPSDLTTPQAAGVRLVSPGFFKAIGTRLVAGRDFSDADQAAGERVAIINRVMATRYFGNLDPVGRQIDIAGPRRIVGVVESIKPAGFDSQAAPELFFPMTQFAQLLMAEGPLSATTLVIRTAGEPTSLVPAVRTEVAGLDPQLPLFGITTLSQRVSDSVAQPRFYAGVLAIFAGLALVLAAVGIYGVLSSQVEQSTREIGIQIALGAGPGRIRRSVLSRGAVLAGSGLAIGLAGAWGLSRFISALLFGITPFDVSTYTASAAALAAVALAGAYLPARRATEVDPVVALRYE
jgi:predicted permease